MLRHSLIVGAAALLFTMWTSNEAQAWGAYHVGYTHVGPSGVQHYGHTAAYGGGRAYSGSHYGGASYGGARYGGGSFGGASFGGARYGGASYGGYHYGYRSGYARRW